MFIVRGNNVFPSAVEAIVRRFQEVAEFRVEAYDDGPLTQIRIEVEPKPGAVGVARTLGSGASGAESGGTEDEDGASLAARVQQALASNLSFRAEVRAVAPGTLPRFEMKAKRFVRRRGEVKQVVE
jgi:phenylacetate-CoA ligase